jgi:hypothetical protein
LLPIPDDPRFPRALQLWDEGWFQQYPHPRSIWLGTVEALLREYYPTANADSLKLTARHSAPFYLRDGHDVP